MDETPHRPVALVTDEALLDELLRLAAAAGCELDRVPDAAAMRGKWTGAPMVLLDQRGARECVHAELTRRSDVLLVCPGPPEPAGWQDAVALGVERVVELPAAESWLIGALADVREEPSAQQGRVLAVLGGRGGAGASVLAAAIGQAVVRDGGHGLLVDCDPLGGGLDLALGAESEAGLRWPALKLTGGRVAVSALRSVLPKRPRGGGCLTVLSCDREGPGPQPQAVAAVVEAGRRGGDTVVCDLPRQLTDAAGAVLDRADLAVLVVPAEVRACAAAKRVARHVQERGTELRLLVRGPSPGGLRGEQVADVVGIPLLASMRPEPGLAAALDRGRFPDRARGPLAGAARVVLKALQS
ncbi:MAG TPA: septum site-determining protein Ssd [Pseudonocardiaceae bacterium]|nr:septum site-determining protein Ssd [Pseudonocardiaceae bacterium]